MNEKIKALKDVALRKLKLKEQRITELETALEEKSSEGTVVIKTESKVRVLNFPESFKVENQPTEIKVSNLPKVQDVRIVPDPKSAEKVQKVTIENVEELKAQHAETEKASGWVPAFVSKAMEKMADFTLKLWQSGIVVRLDAGERQQAQAVIVVDSTGRPINWNALRGNSGGSQGGGAMIFHSNTNPNLGNKILSGRAKVITPGAPVPLSVSSQAIISVIITAPSQNVGEIYVGGVNVSAATGSQKGDLLEPTGSITISINDLSKVYIDAQNANDAVTFNYLTT